MKRRWSFRARLFAGALAWSIGLLVLTSAGLAHMMDRHPYSPRVVHRALQHPITMAFTLGCLIVGVLQIRSGLSGIDRVRQQLAALHDGRARRLEGSYPSEVEPLVADLNLLLDQRDEAVQRALTTAGNLAHGLKTPLAVLTNEAARASASGAADVASSIDQQVMRMRRQVDYQLARARVLSGNVGVTRCILRESVDGLVRVLVRLHDDRDLAIDVDVDAALSIRALRSDVDEILGNLLDNACRWAKRRVLVTATSSDGAVYISVDDDGPGLAAEMWDRVLLRGVRADEAGGSGLGLAIARELSELYGGALTLGRSELDGLRATVRLPI